MSSVGKFCIAATTSGWTLASIIQGVCCYLDLSDRSTTSTVGVDFHRYHEKAKVGRLHPDLCEKRHTLVDFITGILKSDLILAGSRFWKK